MRGSLAQVRRTRDAEVCEHGQRHDSGNKGQGLDRTENEPHHIGRWEGVQMQMHGVSLPDGLMSMAKVNIKLDTGAVSILHHMSQYLQ